MAIEPEAWPYFLHPVGFVTVVTGAEINKLDPIMIDDLFHQCGGQSGAGRELLRIGQMGKLVNIGSAAFDRPELGRDRPILVPRDRKSNSSGIAFFLGKAFEKGWVAFAGFPALSIYMFVDFPCIIIE